MPGYSETVGDQLKRQRLGPTFVRRGMRPRCAPKPMVPRRDIAISEGPSGRHAGGVHDVSISIPPDVLADRDRRMAMRPRSLTAALMGDPPAPDWHKRER